MTVFGSRFTAGYQFPRTDHATYKREPAVREEKHGDAIIRLVPLSGGRPLYEIHAEWVEVKEVAGQLGPTTILWPWHAESIDDARRVFSELAAGFSSGDFPAGLP